MTCPIRHGNTTMISKMGPMIAMGSAKAQFSMVKLVYELKSPRATRVRDEETQKMANILAHATPHCI
jgi:hypothetical protein